MTNKNVVVVKTKTSGAIDATTGVTLVNVPTATANNLVTRLDKLQDVDATTETDNATLVYRAADDKYIVKQLDLDGGNF
jgi:hypothetical protein